MNELESFDSKEEWYFHLWIEELKTHGLILEAVYHPKPFLLFDPVSVLYQKQQVRKVKECSVIILAEHSYQADWLIYWNDRLKNILFTDLSLPVRSPKEIPFTARWSSRGSFFSVIDVKGNFNQNDAWRRFSIDQKWVYQKYNIHVNKIIPMPRITKKGKASPASALFMKTFLPQRILYTDKSLKERKINFKFRMIEDYLSEVGL